MSLFVVWMWPSAGDWVGVMLWSLSLWQSLFLCQRSACQLAAWRQPRSAENYITFKIIVSFLFLYMLIYVDLERY